MPSYRVAEVRGLPETVVVAGRAVALPRCGPLVGVAALTGWPAFASSVAGAPVLPGLPPSFQAATDHCG
jgi:hypothetical protein